MYTIHICVRIYRKDNNTEQMEENSSVRLNLGVLLLIHVDGVYMSMLRGGGT